MEYYVVDTETNGLSSRHEITQISVIRCKDRNQMTKFIKIKHPERTSYQALTATGRTFEDLKKGDPANIVVDQVHDFICSDGLDSESRCIIGHNIVSFDRRFLNALWSSVGKTFPATCWLCTMSSAKEYMTKHLGLVKPKKGLQDVLKTLGLKAREGAHTADSDTQNTYILREHLIKKGFDFLPHIKRFAHEDSHSDEDYDQ